MMLLFSQFLRVSDQAWLGWGPRLWDSHKAEVVLGSMRKDPLPSSLIWVLVGLSSSAVVGLRLLEIQASPSAHHSMAASGAFSW